MSLFKLSEIKLITQNIVFRDSSMVEQLPVKELVVGSSPTRGANKNSPRNMGYFLYQICTRTGRSNLFDFID